MIDRFPLTDHKTLLPVHEIDIILYSHLLYKSEPDDIKLFWKNYPYFDPRIINSDEQKYHFLELTKLDPESPIFIEKLNLYLNVKFNPVNHYRHLESNLENFQSLSTQASAILRDILIRAGLPSFVESVLRESDIVFRTNHIIDLTKLYKNSRDIKTKYEITRKIGLTFLLSRVKNCLTFQKSKKYHRYIDRLFNQQLGLKKNSLIEPYPLYYWLNKDDRLVYFYDKEQAEKNYLKDRKEREKRGKIAYPVQNETFYDIKTFLGNKVLKYISRIKNYHQNTENYTSVIEKIVRKNLLYPADIFDIYGVTFVVKDDNDLYHLMGEIEQFLGGTNTRKDEKRIQKAPISEFISLNHGEYFKIWKAIYDITLPHERLEVINLQIRDYKEDIRLLESLLDQSQYCHETTYQKKLANHFEKKKKGLEKLRKIHENYENKSFDLQVEIQIQELHSYLLSKCYGSETEHEALKKQQVLSSSLYKLFPKIIYEHHLINLKEKFLSKYVEHSS